MKGYLAIVLLVIAILGIIVLAVLSDQAKPSRNSPNKQQQKEITVDGVINTISADRLSLTVDTSGGREFDVSLDKNTAVQDNQNKMIPLTELHKGFTIRATGTLISDSSIKGDRLTVTKMPNIILYEPKNQSLITNTFVINGIARVFENVVSLRIKNLRTNKLLLTATLEAKSPDIGQYGPFSHTVTFTPDKFKRGDQVEITAFQNSAKDGSEIDAVTSTVIYDTIEHMTLKVYFPNDTLNTSDSCESVYSVSRDLPKTPAVAKAAIDELLKGPTENEVIEGYATALNDDVTLKSIIIRDSVTYADFTSSLQKNLTGACRISALKNQIEKTLLQFPSITEVRILINGKPISQISQ